MRSGADLINDVIGKLCLGEPHNQSARLRSNGQGRFGVFRSVKPLPRAARPMCTAAPRAERACKNSARSSFWSWFLSATSALRLASVGSGAHRAARACLKHEKSFSSRLGSERAALRWLSRAACGPDPQGQPRTFSVSHYCSALRLLLLRALHLLMMLSGERPASVTSIPA